MAVSCTLIFNFPKTDVSFPKTGVSFPKTDVSFPKTDVSFWKIYYILHLSLIHYIVFNHIFRYSFNLIKVVRIHKCLYFLTSWCTYIT